MLNQPFWKDYGKSIDPEKLEIGDLENCVYTSKRQEKRKRVERGRQQ